MRNLALDLKGERECLVKLYEPLFAQSKPHFLVSSTLKGQFTQNVKSDKHASTEETARQNTGYESEVQKRKMLEDFNLSQEETGFRLL